MSWLTTFSATLVSRSNFEMKQTLELEDWTLAACVAMVCTVMICGIKACMTLEARTLWRPWHTKNPSYGSKKSRGGSKKAY